MSRVASASLYYRAVAHGHTRLTNGADHVMVYVSYQEWEVVLQTRLLEHVDPLSDDPLILIRLMRIGHEEDLGGEPVPIGIRNAAGHVYRVLLTVGVGETVRLLRVMQQLGFAEEDRRSPAEGCQLTFRRPTVVPRTGAWQTNFQPSAKAQTHLRMH